MAWKTNSGVKTTGRQDPFQFTMLPECGTVSTWIDITVSIRKYKLQNCFPSRTLMSCFKLKLHFKYRF